MRPASKNHTPKKLRGQYKPLRVVELFAGVGGFRIGLAGTPEEPKDGFEVVWANQWEPGTKRQHAYEVYEKRFLQNASEEEKLHSNTDIAEVVRLAKKGKFKIPDHDLLVGGFPCQDYSVARTLSQAAGIVGKKGVLWWEIRNILEIKARERKPVPYIFLENVDRLLKSPAKQRGRDFAIILKSLNDLGYIVEWRVINAADYGLPQRRRRTFILAYRNGTTIEKQLRQFQPSDWITTSGTLANAFPILPTEEITDFTINGSLGEVSEKFNREQSDSPFMTAGFMKNGKVTTARAIPDFKGKTIPLGDVLVKESEVPPEYFVKKSDLPKWKYLKGAKKEPRKKPNGETFFYTEGPMVFPDPLNKPSRTIITAEGGSTPSRFKHVIRTESGRLRRLMPVELELLNMFPKNHTEGQTDTKRAFFMGNALVVGAIEKVGDELLLVARRKIKVKNSLSIRGKRRSSPIFVPEFAQA